MEDNIPDYHNYLVATENGTWEDVLNGGEYSEDGYELIRLTPIENGNKFIIPEGVRSINIQNSGCAFMKHIVIASTVDKIKDIAGFSICGYVDNLSPHFVIEKGILYSADKEELIFAFGCLLEEEEEVIISDGVRKIRTGAFAGCEYIKNIKLPISVKEIGHSAFSCADSLESITIPSGVSIIKSDTFAFCDELKYVELPDTLTTIEEGAFRYCENLEFVRLPMSLRTIGKDIFKGCEKLIKEMSVDEMEKYIIMYDENCKASGAVRYFLNERKYKINSSMEWNNEILNEIDRVNNHLSELCIEVYKEATELLERLKKDVLLNYKDIEIIATITPSVEDINEDNTNEDRIDEILFNDIQNRTFECFQLLINYDRDEPRIFDHYDCYFKENGVLDQSWASPTFKELYSKHGDFPVCYALHCLHEHSKYSILDILKIKEYYAEINVTFNERNSSRITPDANI